MFEIGAGAEVVGSVGDLMGVVVVVASEDEVDKARRGVGGEFDVVGFSAVC